MVHGWWRGSLTVMVVLNARVLPSDAEWEAYVEDFSAAFQKKSADASRVYALAVSDGVAPTARQRERLAAMVGDRPVRWVLLSTSRFARGVATALSWIKPDFKAYAPADFSRGARFLGIPETEHRSLLGRIRELDRAVGLSAVAGLALEGLELNS
jgi:hypothetical protein